MRWQTEQRYYRIESYRDMFGHLVVAVAHGGRHNNVGQLRIIAVADEAEKEQVVKQMTRRRLLHHYKPVTQ